MNFDDTFVGTIQILIKEKINKECHRMTKEAIDDMIPKLWERINMLVAEVSVEVLKVVTFEHVGDKLRIEVKVPKTDK